MRPTTVYHSTSRSAKTRIDRCGFVAARSWVTTDPVSRFDKKQRTLALCLDSEIKGECACECRVPHQILDIPVEGPLTCAGFSQFQLKVKVPVGVCRCRCEGFFGSKDVLLWTLGGIALVATAYGVYNLSRSHHRN